MEVQCLLKGSGWEVRFLIAMGSETTLLDYQSHSHILGVGRGKAVGMQLWAGEDKLDGWIILVKGWCKHFGNEFCISV